MSEGFVIAIDGPAASGKGTIAPKLAKKLQGFYMNTGAMYRCIAYFCLQHGIALADEKAIAQVLPQLSIELEGSTVLLNGQDVTHAITEAAVSQASSKVALLPAVLHDLVRRQREMAESHISQGEVVVAEGRNTGTAVCPDAQVKLYLTASPEVRAQRRLEQMKQRGEQLSYEQVLQETRERDERDRNRALFPLVNDPEAQGYIILDDSELTEEQTITQIENILTEKGLRS